FLLSLAISLPFGWIVYATIQDEIRGLAREELEETRVYFAERTPNVEEFAASARDMTHDHPKNTLAWRIWNDATGDVWSEFGAPDLLAIAPQERVTKSGISAPAEHVRMASGSLDGGLTAVVLLDARPQTERFSRFVLAALGFVLLATGVATLAGHLVALRV